jgi:hypothetical protein
MPKKEVDYSKTIIYKLCCNDMNIKDIYVGHTTDFRNRKYQHKNRCMNPKNPKYHYAVYKFMRDHGSWENWSMIMIEEIECKNKLEAEKRERYWIEELNASLNKCIPSRTKVEYRNVTREHKLIIDKQYREKNKEILAEKQARLYICECGVTGTIHHKTRHEKTKKHLEFINQKKK